MTALRLLLLTPEPAPRPRAAARPVSDARIALVIPAYNAERFLRQLFEDLRRQAGRFDQFVVCDDASTDETAALAQHFGAEVVRHGCSQAKNTALQAVRCPWVHFHDAEDLFGPEFVERARARIEAGGESFDALLLAVEQRDPCRHLVARTVNNCGVYRAALVRSLGGFDVDPAAS